MRGLPFRHIVGLLLGKSPLAPGKKPWPADAGHGEDGCQDEEPGVHGSSLRGVIRLDWLATHCHRLFRLTKTSVNR
jgi:hypothetical protein